MLKYGPGVLRTDMDEVDAVSDTVFNCADNVWMSLAGQRTNFVDHVHSRVSAEAQSARALLDKELRNAQRAVTYIRHLQNTLLPISSLPDEILSLVFLNLNSNVKLVCEPPHSFRTWVRRGLPSGCWVFVTHVCRRWRSVAVNCASMWTQIPLDIGEKWARVFAMRSKGATLSIPTSNSFSTHSWQFNLISRHIHRMREICLKPTAASNVEAYFDLMASSTLDQLAEFELHSNTTLALGHSRGKIFLRPPHLKRVFLANIDISWDSLNWSNLRFVEIHAPIQSHLSNLSLLITSLASARALESMRLYFEKCHFDPPTSSSLTAARLPRLRTFTFFGFAADFEQLVKLLDLPSTTRCTINLRSDRRGAARPSVVSAFLQARTCYNQGRQDCIKVEGLELSTSRYNADICLDAYQLEAQSTPLRYIRDDSFIKVYLHLPPEVAQDAHTELANLCKDVELKSLRRLDVELCESGSGSRWGDTTWHTLFSSARAVESVSLEGPQFDHFFEALVAPLGSTMEEDQSPVLRERASVLFPSLSYLQLVAFEAIPHPRLGDLSDWIKARALYAPIKTLLLDRCSIEDDTLWKLSQTSGLELNWDGSHGTFSSPEPEECEECGGGGCHECRGSDWNSQYSL